MLLTRRAFFLLLVTAFILASATFAPGLVVVALIYLAMIAAMIYADMRVTPKAADFQLHRRHDLRLSLGADNAVTVLLSQNGGRTVNVELRDEYPPEFAASTVVLNARQRVALADTSVVSGDGDSRGDALSPGEVAAYRYTLRPPRRGDYVFGDLNLRWSGVFGMIRRQARFPAASEIKVYPNLLDIRRYELLAKRGHLTEMGFRRVRLLGGGTEFERLREYTFDDEFRKIDWKATARRNKPIVREYETERSQNIMILLDTGRLMRAPVQQLTKVDYAVNAALMLTYVAGIRGDRIGLLTFADAPVNYLAPRPGNAQFQRMLGMLYGVNAQPVEASYSRAVTLLNTRQKKRSLIVVFTDIASGLGESALVNHISILAPRHVPLVVTVNDPDVVALTTSDVIDSQSLYERAIAEQMLNQRAFVMQSLRSLGVHTLDVPANKLTIEVINRYLELKARGQI